MFKFTFAFAFVLRFHGPVQPWKEQGQAHDLSRLDSPVLGYSRRGWVLTAGTINTVMSSAVMGVDLLYPRLPVLVGPSLLLYPPSWDLPPADRLAG